MHVYICVIYISIYIYIYAHTCVYTYVSPAPALELATRLARVSRPPLNTSYSYFTKHNKQHTHKQQSQTNKLQHNHFAVLPINQKMALNQGARRRSASDLRGQTLDARRGGRQGPRPRALAEQGRPSVCVRTNVCTHVCLSVCQSVRLYGWMDGVMYV